MISRALFLFFVVGVVSAFKANPLRRFSTSNKNVVVMNMERSSSSKIAAGLLAIFSGISIASSPVNAANYGGFGSKYSEVVNPKDAVLSEEASAEDVKAGLEGLKSFQNSIAAIRTDLAKDSNIDLTGRLQKEFNPAKVRSALNKYNSAFSEDTQRGTDRLIRNVIQDFTELDREVVVKAGKTRSDNKAKLVEKRLKATADALEELGAFYKK